MNMIRSIQVNFISELYIIRIMATGMDPISTITIKAGTEWDLLLWYVHFYIQVVMFCQIPFVQITCQVHVKSLSCNNFGVSGRVWIDPSGHMTSKRRLSYNDAMTSVRRSYDVMCLLG